MALGLGFSGFWFGCLECRVHAVPRFRDFRFRVLGLGLGPRVRAKLWAKWWVLYEAI